MLTIEKVERIYSVCFRSQVLLFY